MRMAYDRGFVQHNKFYKDGSGKYAAYCHPALIARHLDPAQWHFLHPKQTAPEKFWLAMWPAKKSSLTVLDFDNKQFILGWTQPNKYAYGDPGPNNPLLPIIRIPLDRLLELRRLYDEFPNRRWCISSATLGLHAWENLSRPAAISDIHRAGRPHLKKIGLGTLEIHPMVGRCLRRPFGEDYFTITDGDLLSNWTDQLVFFEHPITPSFESIYRVLKEKMLGQWATYDHWNNPDPKRKKQVHRIDTNLLREELEAIDKWAAKGFPASYNAPVSISMTLEGSSCPTGRMTKSSCAVTLAQVCNAEWVQSCESWAINGLPCEDSLFLVISQLARWLYFIELHHLPESQRLERIKTALVHYCLTKHNSRISRLNGGLEEEVIQHVHRAVDSGIASVDMGFKTHAAVMRQKRERGRYTRVIYLERVLEGKDDSNSSSSCWVYMCPTKKPDFTPLPNQIINQLLDACRATGRAPRIKKTTGQYPIIEKCTAFINAIYQSGGKARVSQETLRKYGFTANNQRELLKAIMVKAGIMTKGGYKSQTASRLYRLTKETIQQLDKQRRPEEQHRAG